MEVVTRDSPKPAVHGEIPVAFCGLPRTAVYRRSSPPFAAHPGPPFTGDHAAVRGSPRPAIHGRSHRRSQLNKTRRSREMVPPPAVKMVPHLAAMMMPPPATMKVPSPTAMMMPPTTAMIMPPLSAKMVPPPAASPDPPKAEVHVPLGVLVSYEGMSWPPVPAPRQRPPVPAPRQRPPVPAPRKLLPVSPLVPSSSPESPLVPSSSAQYLNLTTTLLTINKQQMRSLRQKS